WPGKNAGHVPVVVPAKAGTHSSASRNSGAVAMRYGALSGSCYGTPGPGLCRGDEGGSGENRIVAQPRSATRRFGCAGTIAGYASLTRATQLRGKIHALCRGYREGSRQLFGICTGSSWLYRHRGYRRGDRTTDPGSDRIALGGPARGRIAASAAVEPGRI